MRYLLIFLMCVSPAFGIYSWVIGGAGTGADKNILNGGGYVTGGTATWNTMQLTNGAPTKTITADGVDIDSNGGNVRLTDEAAGGTFTTGMVVGQIQNIDFDNTVNYLSGRFEILSIADADTWTIDYTWTDDEASIDITVYSGGALANPGEVPDADDFNNVGAMLIAGSKIWIRALADYTTEDEAQDSILYINTAGTAGAPVIWEAHSAEVASEKGDFGITTLEANTNGLANCIETAVGGAVYHVFIGFSLELATDDGANCNGTTDNNVTFIRCQFINNGAWGIQGNNFIVAAFCDFDTNGSGGLDGDLGIAVFDSVFRNNTGNALYSDGAVIAIHNLLYDNTGTIGINNGGVGGVIYANTIDSNNQAGSQGIKQDATFPGWWLAANNIFTDCVTGIVDDAAIRQGFIGYNNLYNSNTADTSNVSPVPSDGDKWGNIKKNVAENVLWTADDQTYILASTYKQGGVDAFYTKAYWDDFNGGAGDNPPDPLTGLSFMDMGGLQREEAGGTGGGQPVLGGSVVK